VRGADKRKTMDLEEINDMMVRDDLASLERHWYRTYRGQVPDMDTYNMALEDAFRMMDVKWGKVRHIIFDESIGKYKYMNQNSPERVRRKLRMIDAILTLKHRRREVLPKSKPHHNFDICQQLLEVV